MIEALQGTVLDFGPGVWALVIVVALILIEIFQLGPHSFERKKKITGADSGGSTREGGATGKKFKPGFKQKNSRQRRRKKKFDILKTKPIGDFILVNAPCSFIFVIPENEDFTAGKLVPQFDSSTCTDPGTIYPATVEPGNNYAASLGEEADVTVLERFKDLVECSERINVCLFSSVIPSIYALHKLVDLKKEFQVKLENIEVSVLYEDLDDVDEDPERLEEKEQFLYKNGVSLERMTFV